MPLEYPEQSYYPSAKLRLTIRLDEFGDGSRLAAVPNKSTKNLNGVRDPRGALQAVLDPGAPAGVTRYLIVEQGATQAQPATAQARSSDGLTFDVTVIPSDMVWDQNGIRTADTLSATIKYIDCPIDPRCVRSIAVEAFFGAVKGEDFFAGINGASRTIENGEVSRTEPLNLLPDTYLDDSRRDRTNSRFLGWVDKWDPQWDDNKEPSIRIECRDNTQLLIEQQAPPRLVLDGSVPLDKAIATYLSHFPQCQGITVQYLPGTDTPPTLSSVLLNTAYRPNLGPQPAKGMAGNDKLSVWDYLTDVCGAVGHTIRVSGTVVIIQRPRSVYASTPATRVDDPFQGRVLATGEELVYRRFLYGRNVKSMHTPRTFTKHQPANIEVRCYDTERGTILVERFPLPADRLKYAIPGDAQPDQKWDVKRVYGVKDRALLKQIAQSYYEQQGRNELACEIKTHNLSSFGGGNTDPDILDMQVGDTFEVLVNRSDDEAATLTLIEQAQTIQAKNDVFMRSLGFAPDFAAAYAKAYTNAGFLPQWRLKQMKVTWSAEQGIDIALTGINYIEVRADKSLPAGQEPHTTDTTTQTAPAKVNAPQPVNEQNLTPIPEPAPGEVASTGVSTDPPLVSSM